MVTGTVNTPGTVVKKVKPNHFAMIKNFDGNLAVELQPEDYVGLPRTFRFKFNQEKQMVPLKWALGVFISPPALHQMELGYFTFENLEELIKMAESAGHYVPDSIKEPKISVKDIKKALKTGDKKEFEKILLNATAKVRNDVITAARGMYGKLNQETISFLEKKLKVSLTVVDTNAE